MQGQGIMTGFYNDYKLEQGYSSEEIIGKARSLKGVLEPFSTAGNMDLLQRDVFILHIRGRQNPAPFFGT
jgi:tRNA (cmo5U34)-methyltransferase